MDKSKIPAFLQDRKKLLILCIVALCTIVYTFQSTRYNIRIVNVIAEKTFGIENFSEKIKPTNVVKNSLPDVNVNLNGSGFSGTYENIYADEVLSFKSNGKFTYASGGVKEEGTYTLNDKILTLSLIDWEQSFTVIEQSSDSLILFDGANYYYYQK